MEENDYGLYMDGPRDESALIFYPGAKVEYTAYVPLLCQLAEKGVDVFLIKMPCNLAFLGQNKAEDVMRMYEYGNWYLGGHSLGGAMAAYFAAKHLDDLEGMVLLAAYSTKDLQEDGFSVISLYGSGDGVLNMDKIEESRSYIYGAQKGDGIASISREEQRDQTSKSTVEEDNVERKNGKSASDRIQTESVRTELYGYFRQATITSGLSGLKRFLSLYPETGH